MDALILMIIIFVGYIIMYFLYGKFISKKIFNISGKNSVPSIDLEDGVDYVPTKKEIIFGHHFASIVGTGPIVGTTLDSATRIQQYVLTELFTGLKVNIFKNKYFSTAVAVISAGLLAFSTGIGGKGALKLWPLFGAVNQTLAALVLIIITLFLRKKGGYRWLVSGLPTIFMSVITTWAIILNQISFFESGNILLQIVNFTIFVIAVWIIIEGLLKFFKKTA